MYEFQEGDVVKVLTCSDVSCNRHVLLDHLLGMTASESGCNYIVERPDVFVEILKLSVYGGDPISEKTSAKCLVNLLANESAVTMVINLASEDVQQVLCRFLTCSMDNSCGSNLLCNALCNMTRCAEGGRYISNILLDTPSMGLVKFVATVVSLFKVDLTSFSNLSTLLMNLTQVSRVRVALMSPPGCLLQSLIPLLGFSETTCRGLIGTIKNCCFEYGTCGSIFLDFPNVA